MALWESVRGTFVNPNSVPNEELSLSTTIVLWLLLSIALTVMVKWVLNRFWPEQWRVRDHLGESPLVS